MPRYINSIAHALSAADRLAPVDVVNKDNDEIITMYISIQTASRIKNESVPAFDADVRDW